MRVAGSTYDGVEKFRVFENQMVPLPGRKSPPLMFRLGELEFLMLAHESTRTAFDCDGITGANFTPTEDYVD